MFLFFVSWKCPPFSDNTLTVANLIRLASVTCEHHQVGAFTYRTVAKNCQWNIAEWHLYDVVSATLSLKHLKRDCQRSGEAGGWLILSSWRIFHAGDLIRWIHYSILVVSRVFCCAYKKLGAWNVYRKKEG